MQIIQTMINTLIRRPFILAFFGSFMLISFLINMYNPVFSILFGLSDITGGTIFESLVSGLQIVLDPGVIPTLILILIGLALVVSPIIGVLFSGFLYILHKTLIGERADKGDFTFGLKKYFRKVSLMSLRIVAFAEVFTFFILIACVPAIVVSRAAFGDKPELIGAAILVDLLTAGILFFGLMFARVYLFFWFPAVFRQEARPFRAGKRLADRNFWEIVGRLMVFDILFAVFQYLFIVMNVPFLKFVFNWIFSTIFFLALIIYVFSYYIKQTGKTQG